MSKGRQSESGAEDGSSSIRKPAYRDLTGHLADSSRRNFLIRCCQGASAGFILPGLRGLQFPFFCASGSPTLPSAGTDYHLHPHYRPQLPLEPTLLKTKAGLDEFGTEKYVDQIGAVLAQWSASFLKSPEDVSAIGKILASDFSGASFRAVES